MEENDSIYTEVVLDFGTRTECMEKTLCQCCQSSKKQYNNESELSIFSLNLCLLLRCKVQRTCPKERLHFDVIPQCRDLQIPQMKSGSMLRENTAMVVAGALAASGDASFAMARSSVINNTGARLSGIFA